MSNEESRGFKVTDSRQFDDAGNPRSDADARPSAPDHVEPHPQDPSGDPAQDLPQIEFSDFVMSIATSAIVALGEAPDPESGKRVFDLNAAKQTIEVLNMLKGKTQGNLSQDESRLLDGILYELRLKFVACTQSEG